MGKKGQFGDLWLGSFVLALLFHGAILTGIYWGLPHKRVSDTRIKICEVELVPPAASSRPATPAPIPPKARSKVERRPSSAEKKEVASSHKVTEPTSPPVKKDLISLNPTKKKKEKKKETPKKKKVSREKRPNKQQKNKKINNKTKKPKNPSKDNKKDKQKASPKRQKKNQEALIKNKIREIESRLKAKEEEQYLKKRLAELMAKAGGAGDVEGASDGKSNIARLYGDQVKVRIWRNWHFPEWLVSNEKIRAKVEIKIDRSGRILSKKLIQSSGVPAFDRSVLKAVADSNPLPPFPRALRSSTEDIEITFDLSKAIID